MTTVLDPASPRYPEGLFPVTDAWEGDPLSPGLDAPTPAEVVIELSQSERETRLWALIQQAHDIIDMALAEHLAGRTIAATAVLFSGGNDSTILAHLVRERLDVVIHANTGIGIEQTRQFVRDTASAWDLPLIERHTPPGETYADFVTGRARAKTDPTKQPYPGGFPGPSMHGFMYQRLKERALDGAKHDLGISGSRAAAALYIAGRRRQESDRRSAPGQVVLHERDANLIWASPNAGNEFIRQHPDLFRTQELT